MSKEQWKHGGDCNKCRKQKYCSTECSEKKRRIRKEISSTVAGLLEKGSRLETR